MAKKKSKSVEGAIAGGLIGAALGAFLSGKKEDSVIAALLGAAIGASIKAGEEAKKLNEPYLVEEEGSIYKVFPDGNREFVKEIEKPASTRVPKKFRLD